MLVAGGIKAPLTTPEHRRLQDVSTAPVVLETAVIKVHRKAKGLEIESHCKNTMGQSQKNENEEPQSSGKDNYKKQKMENA